MTQNSKLITTTKNKRAWAMRHALSVKAGFTLVELLVSVVLFTIVTVVAINALLKLAEVNDKGSAIVTAINNLEYALDHMSRSLRVGTSYHCRGTGAGDLPTPDTLESDQGTDCVDGNSAIEFVDETRRSVRYFLDTTNNSVKRTTSAGTFSLTAPEVEILGLRFYVKGALPYPDTFQPRVLMVIRGRTRLPGLHPDEQVPFNIQTTVSMRSILGGQ